MPRSFPSCTKLNGGSNCELRQYNVRYSVSIHLSDSLRSYLYRRRKRLLQSEVLLQVTLTANAREKRNSCFSSSPPKPTSPVHDMNFLNTSWATCFPIFFMVWGLWEMKMQTSISLFFTVSTSCIAWNFLCRWVTARLFLVRLRAQYNAPKYLKFYIYHNIQYRPKVWIHLLIQCVSFLFSWLFTL